MDNDKACPGFSKIVKTQSKEILLACGDIDTLIEFYPFEKQDASHYLSRLKKAVDNLKKYADLFETEMISIRSTIRPVEWNFSSWFSEKIVTISFSVQRLEDYLREYPSFVVLDLISLCLGDIERCARGMLELADSLRVQIVREENTDQCEHIEEKQNIRNGGIDLPSRLSKP